ncbi:MAG TPA: NAD(P)H-hydrate dehydratase, partial [Candidatus Binatia bacterium]|nr:NAD(P)H-hydrate dehydratase [Candidatus Binatia bacterium]
MIAVTAAEMRALDRWTIEHATAGEVLMERAGAGAARVLRERLRAPRGPVVVVCGRGNNGGDGFVVARHLRRARVPVEVWLAARPDALQGDAARMLARWRRVRGTVRELETAAHVEALCRRLEGAALAVDALFGTGLNAQVTGVAAEAIRAMNACGAPVLAVDIASGLSADTGAPLGVAVRATVTATFGYPKVGQLLYPGVEHTGLLAVVDIGIPPAAVAAVTPRVSLLEAEEVGRLLRPRAREAHKGDFGHVLVIAGSRGKTGAALLATQGAARAGAGLTTLAVPAVLQPVLEGQVREAMTTALPEPTDAAALDELLAARAAVVCGPGLGLDDETRARVAAVVRRTKAPLVLDADGLNAIAGTTVLRERPAPTVITPHPGEMARLVGGDTGRVQGDRLGVARAFARTENVVVVLKGARTIIAAPDGGAAICPTGNPGMASGGMGDVLAGIVGGLLAQGLAPFD